MLNLDMEAAEISKGFCRVVHGSLVRSELRSGSDSVSGGVSRVGISPKIQRLCQDLSFYECCSLMAEGVCNLDKSWRSPDELGRCDHHILRSHWTY